MSIITDALKKAQKGQIPILAAEIKNKKQPILGPSSAKYRIKEKTSPKKKKNNPFAVGLLFITLLLLCVTVILTYIQNLQKTYIISQPIPIAANTALNIPVISSLPLPELKPAEEKKVFKLSGIVRDENKPLAVINDNIFEVGQTIDEAKITEINDASVQLTHKGKKLTLYLER